MLRYFGCEWTVCTVFVRVMCCYWTVFCSLGSSAHSTPAAIEQLGIIVLAFWRFHISQPPNSPNRPILVWSNSSVGNNVVTSGTRTVGLWDSNVLCSATKQFAPPAFFVCVFALIYNVQRKRVFLLFSHSPYIQRPVCITACVCKQVKIRNHSYHLLVLSLLNVCHRLATRSMLLWISGLWLKCFAS